MDRLNDLIKNKNLSLQKGYDDNVTAVRLVKGYNNSYARNMAHPDAIGTEGCVTALSLSDSDVEMLELGAADADLEYLYLSGNKSLKKVVFETALPRLTHLYLDGCALEEIEIPAGCIALQQLYVQNNKLTKLVFNGDCPALILLDASSNQLMHFGLLYGFGQLKYLYLNNNQLENVNFNHYLYCLNTLNLAGNKLKTFPDRLSNLSLMETLYLKGNDLTAIDREIWDTDTNCWDRIKPYLFSLEKAGTKKIRLQEAKMILIGNGEVGKTSIRLRLIDEKADLPDKKDRTQGLDVESYFIKNLSSPNLHSSEAIDFKLNIWDFGGQGRYREVQQLFCSRKSLYLYVTSPDDKPENNQAYVGYEYWLSMVNAFMQRAESGLNNSPIIYVQNKSDLFKSGEKFINEKEIIDKGFSNIHDFINISADKLTNFSAFRQLINDAISKISEDIFTAEYSEHWIAVKQELENQKNKNHIKRSDFNQICSDKDLTDDEADAWLHILDRIGTVIYFGNNEALKDWVILNPIWVKDAIYEVIDFEFYTEIATLTPAFLTKIWKEYSVEEQGKLKELLLAYNFCYEENGKYIVPALFSDEKPELDAPLDTFDYQIELRYKPYLPAGTLHKFMVILNKKIYNNLRWKTGVVLHDAINNTYAEITEDWQKHTLTIRLKGKNEQLMPIWVLIRDTLKKLNHDLKETKFLKTLDFETFCWYGDEWLTLSTMQKVDGGKYFTFLFEKGGTDNNTHVLPIDRGIVKRVKQERLNTPLEIKMQQGARTFTPFGKIKEKITILSLSANPDDSKWLRTDREGKKVKLEQRLSADKSKFAIIEEQAVTLKDMQRAIVLHQPHLIHFSGHGDTKSIYLEDRDVTTDILVKLCKSSKKTQLVILNACKSLSHAEKIAEHIPYVIGNDDTIDDTAAIEFSEGFYMSFFAFNSIEDAVENGRLSVEIADLPDSDVPVLVKGIPQT